MEEEKGFCKSEDEQWRVLEFYSGIGGMRYSLKKAGVNAKVVEAFEINEKANDVYQHNFGHRPYQSLSASDLDSYGAHVWFLSPPCQPYTRQGSEDARAHSFLSLLQLIPQTLKPPLVFFVENVVGFETSNTHNIMIEILQKTGFVTQEFILTPLQFGVPYSRPRYFLLAKRKPSSFRYAQYNNQLLWTPKFAHENTLIDENDHSQESCDKMLPSCEPIEKFLGVKNSSNQVENKSGFLHPTTTTVSSANLEENTGLYGSDDSFLELYTVPLKSIEKWGSAMDIVYPDSQRCCCFTKSYYRYVTGTGSLLATVQYLCEVGLTRMKNPSSTIPCRNQSQHKDKVFSLKEQGLRYFTPREVANLHSFPEDFQFPQFLSLRQRYALLGNSLSVAVVAPLLQYLFAEPK